MSQAAPPEGATLLTRSAYGPSISHRAAAADPATFDATDNSLEVIWTTGAAVNRFGLFEGHFIETLEVTPEAIRADRLNGGAAVLDSHDMYELAASIGSVVPGTVRVAGGQGTARIRLADTPDVADTVAKIRAGHLRHVSVGYFVHTYERHRGEDGEPDELRAIDWEPVEISFVTVPADPGAHVRSETNDMTRIIEGGPRRPAAHSRAAPAIINRDGAPGRQQEAGVEPSEDNDDRQPGRRERAGGRQSRHATVTVDRIREICDRANFSREFERSLLDDHAASPMTEAQMLRAVNDELVGNRPSIDARAVEAPLQGGDRRGSPGQLVERVAGAIFARLGGTAPDEQSREFMGASMIDMARGMMEARGERVRWASPSAIVQRMGAHTTSDFSVAMGSALNRYLLAFVNNNASPLRAIARQRTANDYRKLTVARFSANPELLLVPEMGEFKRGTVIEAKETYGLSTYGRIFALSRQAIINDDLGAFRDVFDGWARSALDLEADMLAGLIVSNPMMDDGNRLYSAAHGNVAGSGSAINVNSVSAGRQAMRTQKDLNGTSIIGVPPRYLVVGPAKETEAEAFLASTTPTTSADVNPFAGRLELVVDNRITGNGWRLFADPAAMPVIEEARLAGQEEVYVDTRVGFDVDGVESKARLDLGAGLVDWRGTYFDPGN